MKKHSKHFFLTLAFLLTVAVVLFAGCGSSSDSSSKSSLEDGNYTAVFKSDNKMFHVNDQYNDQVTLTVEDGKITMHIVMPSENIVKLFVGTKEDAEKSGADVIEPTTETVKYDDGTTEEVYAFDVPIPDVNEEFTMSLLGTKGKWYQHQVTVSDPQKK